VSEMIRTLVQEALDLAHSPGHDQQQAIVERLKKIQVVVGARVPPFENYQGTEYNEAWEAWKAQMPAKHWAKYDLSACRLGFEAAQTMALEAIEQNAPGPCPAVQPALPCGADHARDKFARLGRWVIERRQDEIGDIDASDVQDKMEMLGILHGVPVTEACGENCQCVQWDDFPQTCLRLTDDVLAAMRGKGGDGKR